MEVMLWIVVGVLICSVLPVAFISGFYLGRARGHAEGYHRAWGIMGGANRKW